MLNFEDQNLYSFGIIRLANYSRKVLLHSRLSCPDLCLDGLDLSSEPDSLLLIGLLLVPAFFDLFVDSTALLKSHLMLILLGLQTHFDPADFVLLNR